MVKLLKLFDATCHGKGRVVNAHSVMSFGYDELLNIAPEQAVKFTFEGVERSALRGDLSETKELGMGGYSIGVDLVLVAPLVQFGLDPAPTEQNLVTIGGVDYRVIKTTVDPGAEIIVLELQRADKGV